MWKGSQNFGFSTLLNFHSEIILCLYAPIGSSNSFYFQHFKCFSHVKCMFPSTGGQNRVRIELQLHGGSDESFIMAHSFSRMYVQYMPLHRPQTAYNFSISSDSLMETRYVHVQDVKMVAWVWNHTCSAVLIQVLYHRIFVFSSPYPRKSLYCLYFNARACYSPSENLEVYSCFC